ncbi:hypothetical protein BGZ68_001594 [Mortierella alpina]|nr:hypothetical protein BGZ68_001594 [Mortierella alpina]
MSFLISRRNKKPTRAEQRKALEKQTGITGVSAGPSVKRQIPTKPAPEPAPGTYTDYKLVSASDNVLHHVMRFHGGKNVNPATLAAPVKLQRKRTETPYNRYYNRYNQYNNQGQNNTGAAASNSTEAGISGSSGSKDATNSKDAAGSTTAGAQPATGADMALIAPFGGGVRNKQMLFKKRTKQVYLANEEERKKKEIESAPWVLEDCDGQNTWTGQLEGGQQANYYVFVFSDDGFKVVKADKWYKFNPKIPYATLTAEEAEEQYEKAQKQPSSSRWLMRSKNKRKREDGEEGAEDDVEGEQLITVDHEDEAGYDEDEAKERRKKRGKHGDVDEMDFDEVWQDDEEMPSEMPGFEEDAKDDPRKKYGQAADSDEDEDEAEDQSRLNETGKAIKKALLKLEKNKVYADDDDKDPYASDQDSSDSDLDEIDKEKDAKKEDGVHAAPQEAAKPSAKGKANAKVPLIAKKPSAMKPATPSKAMSAKATKAKSAPLPNPRNASLPSSEVNKTTTAPSSSPSSKAVTSSKVASAKATKSKSSALPTPRNASASALQSSDTHKTPSTSASSSASMASPPAAVQGRSGSPGATEKKRKRPIEGEGSEAGSSKKSSHSADSAASTDDQWLITEEEIVNVLKSRPGLTTRDLIVALGKKLKKDSRNKTILAALVKKVAVAKDGILALREGL